VESGPLRALPHTGPHAHLSPTELVPQSPKPHADPSPAGPPQAGGKQGQKYSGRRGGRKMGKGPATSKAAPPKGGPEFEAWVGAVQASVLLESPCRDGAA